jgi:hypothetical protein
MEKIDLTKKTKYPFRFGTLITCIVMYFLNCFPLDNNVVWKENEPIYKQIFLHLNNLVKSDELYESFFDIFLEKLSVTILVKALEVGSSFGVVESKKRRTK